MTEGIAIAFSDLIEGYQLSRNARGEGEKP
jgi:hypothetical protein